MNLLGASWMAGPVTFTELDAILWSHFRISKPMLGRAMDVGVGAFAIWKGRTGEGQDLRIDLLKAVYNIKQFSRPPYSSASRRQASRLMILSLEASVHANNYAKRWSVSEARSRSYSLRRRITGTETLPVSIHISTVNR